MDGVGGWGGTCVCPNGQSYNVADNNDACGSLACEGGTALNCESFSSPERLGMKVTCAREAMVENCANLPYNQHQNEGLFASLKRGDTVAA